MKDAKLEGANFSGASGFKKQLCTAESFYETTIRPKYIEGMTMAKFREGEGD